MSEQYDTTNGILDLHIGKQTRTLKFLRPQQYVLGKRLGSDPMQFFVDGGDEGVFLAEAILAGLSKDPEAKKEKVNLVRVFDWLTEMANEDEDYDEDELKIAILYAIARGKPKKQAEADIALLDEMFNRTDGGPKVPLVASSGSSTIPSASLSKSPATG